MARRRPNYRLVKGHRSYTVKEIADLCQVTRNTVHTWIKRLGLPKLDGRRPILVRGADLSEFLRARSQKAKHPCQPGQIYCVRCRLPQFPAGEIADYQQVTAIVGNLIGICPACDTMIYRRVNVAKLEQVRGKLEISVTEAHRRISETADPSVDRDMSRSSGG